MVECQLPKLDVGGSNPLARYKPFQKRHLDPFDRFPMIANHKEVRSLLVAVSPLFARFDYI